MFNQPSVILADIATSLQQAGGVSSLEPFWSSLVSEWQPFAYTAILGILSGRKYTLAQILAADNGPGWERSLSRYFIFTQPQSRGGGFSPEEIKLWDVQPMLKTMVIIAAGVPIYPAGGPTDPVPGEIGTGAVTRHHGDEPPRWGQHHDDCGRGY